VSTTVHEFLFLTMKLVKQDTPAHFGVKFGHTVVPTNTLGTMVPKQLVVFKTFARVFHMTETSNFAIDMDLRYRYW
jgi:hypothetical protein